MVKRLQEPVSVLCRARQERISLESQFYFVCGFVMIMIVLLCLIFLFCEQLKEAEERVAYPARKGRGDCDSLPLSNQHLKSKGSFQPFHLEK